MTLPTLQQAFAGASTSTIVEQWLEGFLPCNPSIAQGSEGYAVIVTCRDLVRHDNGTHSFADASGTIRTRNFFGHLDPHTLLLSSPLTELAQPDVPVVNGAVLGVEDPRLYWDQEWRYSGTIAQHHASGEQRMALCTVANGLQEIVPAPDGERVKNLMPTGSEPAFIDVKAQRHDLHGGAVVAYEDGYLGIVHDIRWPGRVYSHYFAQFDHNGNMVNLSQPFKLDNVAIEFACGIVLHGNDVVVSYGVQDKQARLARLPLEEIKRAL